MRAPPLVSVASALRANSFPAPGSRPPPLPPQSKTTIYANPKQRGNPVLEYVKNVVVEYHQGVVADYLLGAHTHALYLSLQYYKAYPKYLLMRMGMVRSHARQSTRILLCHVDVEDHKAALLEVTRVAFMNDWTLVCAFSMLEAARYLETFKLFENKPADMIKNKFDKSQKDKRVQFARTLQTIKSVNKTDVATLATAFGSLRAIANASMEELARCPGLGSKKIRRIHDAFHEPLMPSKKKHRGGGVGGGASGGANGGASGGASGGDGSQLSLKAMLAAADVSDGDEDEGEDEEEEEDDDDDDDDDDDVQVLP